MWHHPPFPLLPSGDNNASISTTSGSSSGGSSRSGSSSSTPTGQQEEEDAQSFMEDYANDGYGSGDYEDEFQVEDISSRNNNSGSGSSVEDTSAGSDVGQLIINGRQTFLGTCGVPDGDPLGPWCFVQAETCTR